MIGEVQTVAGAGDALRRVSRWELRALPRIGIGLAVNLLLAFSWILISPLQYTDRNKVAVIVVYFATFVLADSVTTNMFADQAGRRTGGNGYWRSFALIAVRNVTLFLALGVPLLVATAVLALIGRRPVMTPFAVSAVSVQIMVWLAVCSILATCFPVAAFGPRTMWRERRDRRSTAWRLVAVAAPYGLLWLLLPADDGRRRLPGLGAMHRRTPGAQGVDFLHQAIGAVIGGLLIWLLCMLIGAWVARRRSWRPRA
jgi:hypothetical protein